MPEAPREPVGVSPRVDCVFKPSSAHTPVVARPSSASFASTYAC